MSRYVAFPRRMNLGGRPAATSSSGTGGGRRSRSWRRGWKRSCGGCSRKKVLALATDEDLLAIEGRELYWLPSGGLSESDLDSKALDAALLGGVDETIGERLEVHR